MFERLIAIIIEFLSSIVKELNRAYYETFGDRASYDGELLSYDFFDEVARRRVVNKDLYLRQTAICIGKKTLKEQGFIMPPMQALAIAEAMFIDAQNKGKVDFLNNVVSEE